MWRSFGAKPDPHWWPEVTKVNPMLHLDYCYDAEFVNRAGRNLTLYLRDVTHVERQTGVAIPHVLPRLSPLAASFVGSAGSRRPEYPVPNGQTLRRPVGLIGSVTDYSRFGPGEYTVQASFADTTTGEVYRSAPVTVAITQQDIDDYRSAFGGDG